jgi:hypothetical protein
VAPTCRLRDSSFDIDMATSSSSSSLQGSTIVVRPCIDSQPSMRCCTRCGQDFPGTSAYFKAFKKGGLAATCVDCAARISAAKRVKNKVFTGSSPQKFVAERGEYSEIRIQMCSGKRLGLHRRSLHDGIWLRSTRKNR